MLHKSKCSFGKTTWVLAFMLALVLCAFGAMTAMAQTDTTPPIFISSDPANGATLAELPNRTVICYYNENEILDAAKCDLDIITFKDSSGKDVPLDEVYGKDIQIDSLVITPKAFLEENTTYIIHIPEGAIQDNAGNQAEAVTIIFSTGEEIDLPDVAPAVTTGAVTDVTETSATLNGTIEDNGGAAVTEYGFEWTEDNITWNTVTVGTSDDTDQFNYDLVGLTVNSNYTYKAFATNSKGIGYGDPVTFDTLNPSETDADTVISAPIDVTGEAGSLVQVPIKLKSLGNVAGLQFDIKCDGGLLTYASWATGDLTPTDKFSTNVNVLDGGAVRVLIYSENNDGNISQGEGSVVILSFRVAQDAQPGSNCALKLSGFEAVESDAGIIENVVAIDGFFTVPQPVIIELPTVQTLDAANITKVSATINGMVEAPGTSPITEYGFAWSSDQVNWNKEILGNSEPEGIFSKELSELTANTTYYFKSYAVNASGTEDGEVKNFTTLKEPTAPEPSAPVVETKNATTVERTSATLNGSIVDNGGVALDEYGFQWSKDQSDWTTEIVGTEDYSGNFSFKLSNLTASTTYYFKAFAVNEIGRTYGDTLSFRTQSSGGGGGGSGNNRPEVETYEPAKDAKNVAVDAEVSVIFDIRIAKVDNGALDEITIKDADGNEVDGIEVTIDDDMLIIDHDDFVLNTTYTVTIPEDTIRNSRTSASAYYNRAISWKFNTGTGTAEDTKDEDEEPESESESEPGTNNCTYTDVPNSHWANDVITELCRQGIISGYPDGTFKPANNITRAEFAKIIVGAMELAEENPAGPSFNDVSSSAWYFGYVEAAAQANLVEGYSGGQFMPNAQITREQIAAILVRALDKESTALANASATTDFADDRNIAAWARGYVVTAVAEELVGGYPDNTFGPQKNATRAESSAMISRFLEK